MKTSNKKKIVVSTLALAMGAALAGSISGSVAWYQYSTRATAAFTATSAGTSRNLKISTSNIVDVDDSDWGWDVTNADIVASSHEHGTNEDGKLKPVGGTVASNVPTGFKAHPVRQYATLQTAEATDYLQFDLYLESVNEQGAREVVDVYLETLDIAYSGSHDLDQALRIAISDGGSNKFVTALDEYTTVTHGQLDLNGDGVNDRTIFQADDRTGLVKDTSGGDPVWKLLVSKKAVASSEDPNDLVAGSSASGWFTDEECSSPAAAIVAGTTYYKFGEEPADYIDYNAGSADYTTKAWDDLETSFTNEYTVNEEGLFKAKTLADGNLHLSVYVWLEGWAEINGENIWDLDTLNESFSVKMRFQTIAE